MVTIKYLTTTVVYFRFRYVCKSPIKLVGSYIYIYIVRPRGLKAEVLRDEFGEVGSVRLRTGASKHHVLNLRKLICVVLQPDDGVHTMAIRRYDDEVLSLESEDRFHDGYCGR